MKPYGPGASAGQCHTLIEAQAEEADKKMGFCEDNEKAMCLWVAADPKGQRCKIS